MLLRATYIVLSESAVVVTLCYTNCVYFQIEVGYIVYTESILIQILETCMSQRTFRLTMTIELSDDETQRFMQMIETLDLIDNLRDDLRNKFGDSAIKLDDVWTDKSYHDNPIMNSIQ